MVSAPVYAQEKAGLRTLLGAELLRASNFTITAEEHKKIFFNRCGAIEKYMGFSDTPMGRAIEYSCSGMVIGVTLYAGDDLGKHSPEKVAELFKKRLSDDFMTAEVFIKHNHEYGSAMAFFINGESYTEDWIGPMKALELLDGMTADMRLIYLKNKQITAKQLVRWVKGNPP